MKVSPTRQKQLWLFRIELQLAHMFTAVNIKKGSALVHSKYEQLKCSSTDKGKKKKHLENPGFPGSIHTLNSCPF